MVFTLDFHKSGKATTVKTFQWPDAPFLAYIHIHNMIASISISHSILMNNQSTEIKVKGLK